MKRKSILFNNPTPDAYRVSYLANIYTSSFGTFLEMQHDILWHEWVVIFFLAREGGYNARDMSDGTGRPKNTISRAVHKLLRRKLIQRHQDPNDGRAHVLSLTKSGREFYEDILPKLQSHERSLFGILTEDEHIQFDKILTKLVRNASLNSRDKRLAKTLERDDHAESADNC